MIKTFQKYPVEYTLLLIAIAVSIFGLFFSPNSQIKYQTCFLFAVYYFIWACVQQALHHKLTLKIVLEYLLVISLCLVVLKVVST
jgi:uncharacterized metal-binding protein